MPIGLASKWILYFSKTFDDHSSKYGTRESLCWNLRTSFLFINSNIWIFGIVSIIFRLELFLISSKNNIFNFRHVLVKYSQGLVNTKGLITPLYEKLYILLTLTLIILIVINILVKQNNHPWFLTCMNQIQNKEDDDEKGASPRYILISTNLIVLALSGILYASILHKTNGTALAKHCKYRRNLITLKETFALQVVNELYYLFHSLNILSGYDENIIGFSTYCFLFNFLFPLYILFYLRKTMPDFYMSSCNNFDKDKQNSSRKLTNSKLLPRKATTAREDLFQFDELQLRTKTLSSIRPPSFVNMSSSVLNQFSNLPNVE